METTILRMNALPVYGFLSFIHAKQVQCESGSPLKILDCGAGGWVPPLALFAEHGFDAWGIDTSDEQLERAGKYCREQGIQVNLRKGDMRQIPFRDESFDCVFEHYAMCHLSKEDTAKAISEMYRVTKRKGLCYLGVISRDSWPRLSFGEEKAPGEFWMEEENHEELHTMFTDQEADQLTAQWEVLAKEKRVLYLLEEAAQTSVDDWMGLYDGSEDAAAKHAWHAQYQYRVNRFNYTHIYFFLQKP